MLNDNFMEYADGPKPIAEHYANAKLVINGAYTIFTFVLVSGWVHLFFIKWILQHKQELFSIYLINK